jgi:hypothetical protein
MDAACSARSALSADLSSVPGSILECVPALQRPGVPVGTRAHWGGPELLAHVSTVLTLPTCVSSEHIF